MKFVSILLATGISEIESKLESAEIQRCHHRSILLDVVRETSSETVVLSPHLSGEEDLLNSIIIPLRKSGIRVIFLPGTPDMPDVRDWIKKLLPWGVYCYFIDPVTPNKIMYRIQNPGRIKDLPDSFAETAELPDDEIPEIKIPEEKHTIKEVVKEKIQKLVKKKVLEKENVEEPQEVNSALPVPIADIKEEAATKQHKLKNA